MLQFIMWNGQKIWTQKIWIKKKIELKKIWKFFFSVQTYVKPNLVFSKISFMLGGGSKNQSWSEWRETWSHFGIFEIRWNFRNLVRKVNGATSKHTSGHHSDQISRSALRDGATKNHKMTNVFYHKKKTSFVCFCPSFKSYSASKTPYLHCFSASASFNESTKSW